MPTLGGGVPAVLSRHGGALERALLEAVGDGPGPLPTAARYVMGWEDERGRPASVGGKRIRPGLCLFAAEVLGGTAVQAMPGAVAVELVHNFSLVHDEVQDHDAERHHRPTIWALMGEGQAINVGDYLFSRAIHALASGAGPVDRRMQALATLNEAICKMIAGQWEDIAFESRDQVSVDEYLGMSGGKTGALLGAPLEMGAILAGAPAGVAATLGRWGAELGLAFQARDDYLGIWGDPGLTGKSNTNDIARRKKTLPVVHAMADERAAAVVRRAYAGAGEVEDIRGVVRALEAAGADELCRQQARKHADEADRLLAALQLPHGSRDDFREVAEYFIDRSF